MIVNSADVQIIKKGGKIPKQEKTQIFQTEIQQNDKIDKIY